MSRKARFALAGLLVGLSLAGCTPIQHGRMGPWAQQPLWATCKCSDAPAIFGGENRMKNTSFDGGSNCGGDDIDARNRFCAEKCQASGYPQGEYLMCLK